MIKKVRRECENSSLRRSTLLSEWYHVLQTCGQTGCAESFERSKTDSDVLSFVAVFQADPSGVSRSRDARLCARPWSGLSAHYQLGTLNALVNHRSARCSRLWPRFLAAARRGFLGCSCVPARPRHGGKSFERYSISRRNVYIRARFAFTA